jgi:hypothetical protein
VKDPFEGVLGRIPASLAKGPRPILDLKDVASDYFFCFSHVKAETLPHTPGISTTGRSMVITTPMLTNKNRRLLLTIEDAFASLLEVEDLTLILSSLKGKSKFFQFLFWEQ